MCYVSAFSGAGIGDCGIHFGSKIPLAMASEKEIRQGGYNQAKLRQNQGIFWRCQILSCRICATTGITHFGDLKPWLVVLSPPCQGMSANGLGKIMSEVRQNRRPELDERNQLIIPGIQLIESLKPDWFIIENVPRMKHTVIETEEGDLVNIMSSMSRIN
jgi:DNA (cytosine-5)-methyltransferase 1